MESQSDEESLDPWGDTVSTRKNNHMIFDTSCHIVDYETKLKS